MSSGVDAAQQQRNQALAVLLLATIGLTFIGLLSVAGFTVMAQRRSACARHDRRDRRHRPPGAAGDAGQRRRGRRGGRDLPASALGLVGVVRADARRSSGSSGTAIDPFALPWWAVVAGAVLAILTALAASWWPARAAARLPIVAALSGRPAAAAARAPLRAARHGARRGRLRARWSWPTPCTRC